MKKRVVAILVVAIMLAFASTTQAQTPTPPPPVTIAGTALQSTGITTGDPTSNGASAVSTTSILFTGVSSDPNAGLLGMGAVYGRTGVLSEGDGTTNASAGFRTIGLAGVQLNVGPSGSGTTSLSGGVAGSAISTLGTCSTGNCAGAVVSGNATLDSLSSAISQGAVDASAVLRSGGYTQATLGSTTASSMGHVVVGVCATQTLNPSAPPPCSGSPCGGS